MSEGHLRTEIEQRFGKLLREHGFAEIDYLYSAEAFGNECLDLANSTGIQVRFTRGRGQQFIYIAPARMDFMSIDPLLSLLGHAQVSYANERGWPAEGMPQALIEQVQKDFDAVLALLRPEVVHKTQERLAQRFT